MKWCHELEVQLQKLPNILQKSSISYKKWKKISKDRFYTKSQIYKKLKEECGIIDKIYKNYFFNKVNYSCFELPIEIDRLSLQLFVNLNKMSIYKICKRLDKKLHIDLTIWLNDLKKSFKYNFLGGWLNTALFINLPVECPICFESISEIAISQCGHYSCINCLIKLYNMNNRKGTIKNLINYEELHHSSQCIICRFKHPYNKILIWPKDTLLNSKCIHWRDSHIA